MSIKYYDKSGATPQEKLLAGISPVDQVLSGTSKNAISNKAVYNALKEKIEVTIDHLVYFYNKSEVYNKEEVRALIGAIDTLTMEVVSSLPVSDISTTTIYLLKPSGSSVYDEYVYINNAWVKIGTTDMDLSGYMTTAAFNLAIADYYTKAEIDAMIADYYTKDEIDDILENYDSGQFVGTTAEWNALPLADKVQYTTAIFTDDEDYVGNIVDAVTDGEMSAVTSNAVYDITNNPYPRGYAEITVSNNETYGDALTRLYNAADLSKVTCQSKLVHLYVNGSMEIMTIRNIVPGSNYLRFYSIVESQQGNVTIYNVAPASSGSTAYHIKLTTGDNQITNDATVVITDGRSLRIVY